MKGKWDHVINQIDNWMWIVLGVGIFIAGKHFEVDMGLLAGVCVMMAKDGQQAKREGEK